MKITQLPRKALLAVALTGCFSAAHATNGYFAHGYGVKAKGMGGASVAMTDNAFAGANNPAAAAFAGNRWDVGAELFSPRRGMDRTGAGAPNDQSVDSDKNYFLVPEFGYNRMLSDKTAFNLTVYGNGGMNTDYPTGQFNCGAGAANAMCGTTRLGVDLSQLIVAPTFAYKPAENASIGISPLLVYQRFKAYGLQAFANPAGYNAASLANNNGYDDSTGIGVRLGYLGKVSNALTVGASYSPKINMSKFDKYRELFAGGGDFDIPENYTVGLALQATPAVQLALDYQRIKYSGVPSVNNPSTNFPPLGGANGPGFGWQDINVYKLGVQWQANPTWTLRAGYNRGDNPITSRDVTFNILAPGVMKDHYTFGGTMAMSKTDEMSFFVMHSPEVTVTGTSLLGLGTETIKMHQYSAGIQFSRKF